MCACANPNASSSCGSCPCLGIWDIKPASQNGCKPTPSKLEKSFPARSSACSSLNTSSRWRSHSGASLTPRPSFKTTINACGTNEFRGDPSDQGCLPQALSVIYALIATILLVIPQSTTPRPKTRRAVRGPISRVLFFLPVAEKKGRPFIYDRRRRRSLAMYPKARAGRPQTLPYSILLRMGFAMRPPLPTAR